MFLEELNRRIENLNIKNKNTLIAYQRVAKNFAAFCKEKGCPDVEHMGFYCVLYLEYYSNLNISPSTQQTTKCILGKLFETEINYKCDARTRDKLFNNRKERKGYFSKKNNADLVLICKNTGLKRSELLNMRGTDLIEENGLFYVYVPKGVRNKPRKVLIAGQKKLDEKNVVLSEDVKKIVEIMRKAGENNIFLKVSKKAPIERYRQEYAIKIYKENSKPTDKLSFQDKCILRGTEYGVCYDKRALEKVAENLGISRINDAERCYLFPLREEMKVSN